MQELLGLIIILGYRQKGCTVREIDWRSRSQYLLSRSALRLHQTQQVKFGHAQPQEELCPALELALHRLGKDPCPALGKSLAHPRRRKMSLSALHQD